MAALYTLDAPLSSHLSKLGVGKLNDALTVFLNGNGGIEHVVNDTGAAVNNTNQVTYLVNYPPFQLRRIVCSTRPSSMWYN
jgi:hypothetical protein